MHELRQQKLAAFVDWTAQHIKGDEKGEAQIFLERLFQAFGQRGLKEAGASLEYRVRNTKGGTAFADLVWKPVVLVEMKKRGADLTQHLQQAFDYWLQLAPGRPKYVVLCNFDEFRIYDFDSADFFEPKDIVPLADLPERFTPLAFLFPTNEKPIFQIDREKVTREAADKLAAVYNRLHHRPDVGPLTAQRFILQILVALFSEDIGFLPKGFVTQLLEDCTDPPKSFDLLSGLFQAMNTPQNHAGRFKPVPYFNGGLFARPAPVELEPDYEVAKLREACKYDWKYVSPDIFGTLFQHSLNQEDRHAFGAHYTSPADIMKIVKPTIVDPFRQRIEAADTLKELTSLRSALASLRILDPACGSGNFLYIAYREMRRLENDINTKLNTLSKKQSTGQMSLGGVSPKQFFGLDILPFAVELAKVTLAIAPKLASDELHTSEPTLPLANLDANIQHRDALIDEAGNPTPWPAADVIIGNPPFLGAKRLKPEHGPDYINKLRLAYPDVPGMADYCVYWFRRAHDHLPIATPANPHAGRAGLVGTQNIRNNQSRVGGLDHIVKSAVIVDAVENQPWSGEANVHVSIANWVKFADSNPATTMDTSKFPPFMPHVFPLPGRSGLEIRVREARKLLAGMPPPGAIGTLADKRKLAREFLAAYEKALAAKNAALDKTAEQALLIPSPRTLWTKDPAATPVKKTPRKKGTRADKTYEMSSRKVADISATLSDQTDTTEVAVLKSSCEPKRVFQGITPGHEAFLLKPSELRSFSDSKKVIFPYLIGRELLSGDGTPERFLIDFGQRDILEVQQFTSAFARIQAEVLPVRQANLKEGKSDAGKARPHHKRFLDRWWKLAWDRADMIAEISQLKTRYLVCSRVTKRPIFVFVSKTIRPGDALQTFLFDDDYSFGLLQSAPHWTWFVTRSSKLTERLRYTADSVFDTFPWPQSPSAKQVKAVAVAAVHLRKVRADAIASIPGGLRALYRTLELPGKSPLKDAHADLDSAVLDAYGFSPKKDLLAQLLALNHEVAAAEQAGDPVTPPGIPPSYPAKDRAALITKDCIEP